MDIGAVLMGLGLFLCPAIGGGGAIALAIRLHGKSGPERTAGDQIAVVLLSIVGIGLLIVALALGACFGLIGMDSMGNSGHF